jgi:hypothetical protein
MTYKIEPLKNSGMKNFPNSYCVIAIELIMSSNHVYIDRETYGLFAYLGDLGGLIDCLKIIFGCFAYKFSNNRMDAIITNRLYHIPVNSDDIAKRI